VSQRLNINRIGTNNTNKIIVIIAIFSLSVVITGTFFPFEQGKAASAQRQINNNNNNPYLSLSILSTATGTGAAATGIIATVPGVLRTRKQSKCMSVYLLKIHHEYDELKKSSNTRVYLDILEGLRRDIIYLLQRREINENQYKMLDDRIIEYLNKINYQSKITNLK
jgi:hypothetical protein